MILKMSDRDYRFSSSKAISKASTFDAFLKAEDLPKSARSRPQRRILDSLPFLGKVVRDYCCTALCMRFKYMRSAGLSSRSVTQY